jgi:hypothetical protein
MSGGYVTGSECLSDRFAKIRAAYDIHQALVESGEESWMHGDPYAIADWVRIFTPIEYDAWGEIRSRGIPLWPQLPVGKFFVDFGNPVKRIALECDGKEFHDARRDALRDAALLDMGWRVFRVTGSQCYQTRVMLSPADLRDRDEEVDGWYAERFRRETIAGIMDQIQGIFR